LADSIAENTLVAVTDGSYMKKIYPHINSAAFVFECSKGRGRLWGSFVEHTPDAGIYQGELLGLMAIHLILRGVNVVSTNLRGLVLILSNYLGTFNKVKDLLPYRIPTQCSHLDILKNIMANCSNLSFSRLYSHVKARQDNGKVYGKRCTVKLPDGLPGKKGDLRSTGAPRGSRETVSPRTYLRLPRKEQTHLQ
jgi:hypothetical protein